MRRYELMVVLRPDVPDDRTQALIDRTTRGIATAGGQIVKVAPWGRRRLAYPIDRHREGSYHIVIFEAPAESITERGKGRIVAAAEFWISRSPEFSECDFRLDAMLVAPGKIPKHIMNAFEAT